VIEPGRPIHVRKLRPDGSEVFAWDGDILSSDQVGIVLRAIFNVPVVELGFTTFRAGDVFVEFYYWERWYNVFQVSSAEGTLKGWYANVGRPAELDTSGDRAELRYVDLALDVWSDPGGRFQLLDEDEYAELVEKGPLSAEAQAGAAQGRAALVALAESRTLPRWP
jgi:predicted RNA-binding protein associated with RNAse of E/G family